MRGDDNIVHPENRAGRVRLLREHVERGAGDVPALEGVHERVQVDQVATGGVHDPHARLHQMEAFGVDQVPGLGGERRVQRDEVGLEQQVLE